MDAGGPATTWGVVFFAAAAASSFAFGDYEVFVVVTAVAGAAVDNVVSVACGEGL